ncbi:MAG TPA: glutamate--tRNA ligase [Terriglobales bacterium]|nr:glutamate--tRNA ligase [Terriglobales bacterium]
MSDKSKVRVRFAPSPTGQLHVGNVRTALFNWLFARQKGGTMILRIEDTDVERSETRYETQLFEDLKWLGLDWDEGPDITTQPGGGPYGPYRQSDRLQIYHDYAEQLLRERKAYLCFCTEEELEADRQRAVAEQKPHIYSGKCRVLDPAEAEKRRVAGEAAAIRLRIPEHPIRFNDIVRGEVEFSNEVVSDPIITRSSGIPVYNYVVVVDDALMKITHVIRGDDHLSNTPKQVALYEALGMAVPEFAHLSTILGPDRERLSKRHGATSIANFRDMGILPEALMNYLALLGWAPSGGTRETFTAQELVKEFDLRRVTPSPAIFDTEKLAWLNRHYIKQSSADRIAHLAQPYFVKAGLLPEKFSSVDLASYVSTAEFSWFLKVVELLAPYVDQLEQMPERAAMLFHHEAKKALENPDNAEVLKLENTPAVIAAFSKRIAAESGEITAEKFKAIVNEVKTETGTKGKELFHPIRIAIIGSHSGPEFDKLIPIIEAGSKLQLPVHVKSVRERVEEFGRAFARG